jgi:hypothetical protein
MGGTTEVKRHKPSRLLAGRSLGLRCLYDGSFRGRGRSTSDGEKRQEASARSTGPAPFGADRSADMTRWERGWSEEGGAACGGRPIAAHLRPLTLSLSQLAYLVAALLFLGAVLGVAYSSLLRGSR